MLSFWYIQDVQGVLSELHSDAAKKGYNWIILLHSQRLKASKNKITFLPIIKHLHRYKFTLLVRIFQRLHHLSYFRQITYLQKSKITNVILSFKGTTTEFYILMFLCGKYTKNEFLKTTIPRKRVLGKTPFGEHCYLILIDFNITELTNVTK